MRVEAAGTHDPRARVTGPLPGEVTTRLGGIGLASAWVLICCAVIGLTVGGNLRRLALSSGRHEATVHTSLASDGTFWATACQPENRVRLLETEGRLQLFPEPGPTADDWKIQFIRRPIPLRAGFRYRLRFSARADATRPVAIIAARPTTPVDERPLHARRTIDNEWTHFDFRFRAAGDMPDAEVRFELGASAVALEIANVRFEEIRAEQ